MTTNVYDKCLVDELRTRGYDDKDIAKRVAYAREHYYDRNLNHYDMADILEELDYCECGELEERDELTGVQTNRFCRSCRADV